MCAYSNCRNELSVIINSYVELIPTVRGLGAVEVNTVAARMPSGGSSTCMLLVASNLHLKHWLVLL